MQRTCTVTGKKFEITDREVKFLSTMDMPLPTIAPEERLRELMAGRNEWKLYHRTCDATGEKILSAYPPESPYTVFKNSVWWGDGWEALSYGRDIDFHRPFFEQFQELLLAVPREGTSVFESQNCDYNSHIRHSKNCYLNSLVVRSEDLLYSYWMVDVEDMSDCAFHITGKSSLCYECVDFSTCYLCTALQDCHNCSECHFSLQLRGCDHCLFCSNLSNKSYSIENKPCSKEEFERKKSLLLSGSYKEWSAAYARFLALRRETIHRNAFLMNCENVTGDHLFNARNCENSFDGDACEDCMHSVSLNGSKDILSCHSAGWPGCEQLYRCGVSRGCIDMAFCRYMWFCNDMRYSDSCQTCKHCFGCTGLRHKDYCILNKQYTKEEYDVLLKKIIEHMKRTEEWGSFNSYAMLPFAYNESAAQTYLPLSRQEATARGYRWRDVPDEAPQVGTIIPAASLPETIDEVSDDFLQCAIACGETKRPFRIIKQELDFYRSMRLPLPRLHPDERYKRRMALRNPYTLHCRICTKCGKEMKTTYAPDRPEIVYCESCYLHTVY